MARPDDTEMAGAVLDAFTMLVSPSSGLQHAGWDTDTPHANGSLLILVNLLADLAEPLDTTDDVVSAEIAYIVGEGRAAALLAVGALRPCRAYRV